MTIYDLEVGDRIPGQVSFWADQGKVRAYVGGIGSGKTFAGAVAVLMAPAGSTGMVVAPTYPILRDAAQQTFFEICPPALVRSHNKSEGKTVLANGTTILWRSCDNPNSLRGPNLEWIWGDEWAYASEDAHKVIIGRLRLGNPRLWMTTTPNGQNWFWSWAMVRDLGYSIHYGSTRDNVHLASGYIEDLVKAYADDPEYALQELEGKFVDLAGTKRLPGLLVEACRRMARPLTGWRCPQVTGDRGVYAAESTRVYALPAKGNQYVIAADPAEGIRGGDDSALVVLDLATGAVVAVLAGEYDPTYAFPGHLAALSSWYHKAPIMVERNNHGHAVIGGLQRYGITLLTGDDHKPGWRTTGQSKAEMYRAAHASLLDAKDGDRQTLPDPHLVDQIKGIDRKTLKGPGKGRVTKVDDEATAWALACIAMERVKLKSGPAPPDIGPVQGFYVAPVGW